MYEAELLPFGEQATSFGDLAQLGLTDDPRVLLTETEDIRLRHRRQFGSAEVLR